MPLSSQKRTTRFVLRSSSANVKLMETIIFTLSESQIKAWAFLKKTSKGYSNHFSSRLTKKVTKKTVAVTVLVSIFARGSLPNSVEILNTASSLQRAASSFLRLGPSEFYKTVSHRRWKMSKWNSKRQWNQRLHRKSSNQGRHRRNPVPQNQSATTVIHLRKKLKKSLTTYPVSNTSATVVVTQWSPPSFNLQVRKL